MIPALVVVVAVLLQLILVNRLPLPGGGMPDLVLLAVVGVAMMRGPAMGAAIGFCSGLLVDVVPPTAHVAGEYAFVLTVVGFLAGRGLGGVVPTVVACILAAPLLAAVVGGLVGEQGVTLAAVAVKAPVTVVYTLVAAPVVIWAVTRGKQPRYAV
ncbi:rod shape-determining protein MreD [Nonomuraea endophytica]|uniref:Rod shape-determining protein MreD n=1 Tax=Nonomuraea endophytica TaxID=714136 RepID=A0A7W8ELC1_9ACTN|nr:rod shape-determining protein MreD [Nonomuraea endophytica]MBB5083739.1 rod shape-determining protein MreD [Nonomuraea endophytica]